MIKKILFFVLLLGTFSASATHNRAGEIRVEQIGPLTVRATVITYTKTESVDADRSNIDIEWGDGTSTNTQRANGRGDRLDNSVQRNIYISTHTYSGQGTFKVEFADPNRIAGIRNVNFPNSVNVAFYISTTFTFLNGQFQGFNSTPILIQPPIDRGCVGRRFIHNANAFDAEGDSLAYRLAVPQQSAGRNVPLYLFPNQVRAGANNNFNINERTGDLIWDSPQEAGDYNVAFYIISYRGGIPIDTTTRDMQITISGDCNNQPPKVETKDQYCVIAGQKLEFGVQATDPDVGQKIRLTALGGPLQITPSPATFIAPTGYQFPPISGTFTWNTTCEHIQEQPYTLVFKAVDNSIRDTTGIADLKSVNIRVVGPPPLEVTAQAGAGQAIVSWKKPYLCETAANRFFFGFSVWRREGSNPFPFDTCRTGLSGRGYQRIAIDTTFPLVGGKYTFVDNDVQRGKTYCYRIVAIFAKRTTAGNPFNITESLPSDESCTQINRDLPLLTNASVIETSTTTGKIEVRWTKPLANDLDTTKNKPPYRYRLFRSTGIGTNTFAQVAGADFVSPTFAGANDTFFLDTNLNTQQNGYTYRVGFYVESETLLGLCEPASSVFLTVGGSDRQTNLSWNVKTPWANSRYDIFKLNEMTSQYDSIASTTTTSYTDKNLINKKEYCYYIRAIGSYGIASIASPLINLSQRQCGTPIDTVPPCPPILKVRNICDTTTSNVGLPADKNRLTWTNPTTQCQTPDLARFKVYYTETQGGTMRDIQTTNNPIDTTYDHQPDIGIAGCYTVTALDSVGNESAKSNIVCVDNCPTYSLPNAFTPNGDGRNDEYKAYDFRFIASVDLKIFNRWGEVVYQSNDPNFRWNGTNLQGKELATGTYFYTCTVLEQRVTGVVPNPQILSGYIELLR